MGSSLFRFLSGFVGKKTPAKKYASAVRFSDRMVLHSDLRTPYGHFAGEPFCVLRLDARPEVVGAAVLEVLNASRDAEEMPLGKEFGKWFLERMGVKSHAALQRGTYSVGMVMVGGIIEFSPTHNGGSSGDGKGLRPIDGLEVKVAVEAAAGEIAGALPKAFEVCTIAR